MEDHRRSRSSSSSSHSHDLLHILGFVSFCKACKSLISKCCTNKNPSSSFKASSENKIRTKTKQEGDRMKLDPPIQVSCERAGQSPQQNPISTRTDRLTRTMSHDSRSSSSHNLLSRNISSGAFSGPLLKTMSRRNSLNDFSLNRTLSRCGSTARIIYSNSQGPMKPPPMERELECTLEELCFGCIKKIEITRDDVVEENETVMVKVKPGWRRGTKITFDGADRGDVTLVVSEKPHPVFKRVIGRDDLEMRLEITLVEALTCCDVEVPLLGGDVMKLKMEEDVIEPGQEKVVQGQGMPGPDGASRGDLKVIFDVRFPRDQLTHEQRQALVAILLLSPYY